MSQQKKLRYQEFAHRINVDAFEQAIGWEPEYTENDNDRGFCVFPDNHSNGDTTGKFAIHREMRVYNCWACGGGDLLSLTMKLMDMDVEPATHWLYQFCEEDARDDQEFLDEFLDAFRDVEQRVETLPYFNARVLEKFDDPLCNARLGDESFLDSRAISEDTAERYGVRYASSNFHPAPKRRAFAEHEDYVGPAMIFPHYWKQQLVGWQARWLDPERPEWVPKYTMTSDFPKENTVYGLDHLDGNTGLPYLVVESAPSVLFLASCGLQAVATFGSSVNEAQLRVLRRLQNGVILAPDNDGAGIKWENQITEYLKRYIEVWHLPPVNEDPGSDIGDLANEPNPSKALKLYLGQIYQPGIDL